MKRILFILLTALFLAIACKQPVKTPGEKTPPTNVSATPIKPGEPLPVVMNLERSAPVHVSVSNAENTPEDTPVDTEPAALSEATDTWNTTSSLAAMISKWTPWPAVGSPDSCLVPIMGSRLVLQGDFDGDGLADTLTEHFFSNIDHLETNKYYKDLDYDLMVKLNDHQSPFSFVSCSNSKIDTLQIGSGLMFGLSWLKNEGDLNGDGTDELSYVVDLADWSSLNHCTLMTYRNHQWEVLYRFPIWDWQLPDLPMTDSEYGLFGLQDKVIGGDAAASRENFSGFIKKIKSGKIMVWFENKGEQDSAIIRLD